MFKQFIRLSFPSFLYAFGLLLFYTQVSFSWWYFSDFSNVLLSILSLVVLGVGFTIAIKELWKLLGKLETKDRKVKIALGGAFVLLTGVGLFSVLKPTHLIQESDFIRYHLFQAKQHWLAGNWNPVTLGLYEFLSLSNQYALSFLWISLFSFNKASHFLILLFFILKIFFLFEVLGVKRPKLSGALSVIGLFAFRGVAIQVGMAMLDLPILYFLLSLILGLLLLSKAKLKKKEMVLFSLVLGIDCAAYLGYKSFSGAFLVLILFCFAVFLKVFAKHKFLSILKKIKPVYFVLPLLALWAPNLVRSFYYTGDPFFPVLTPLSEKLCVDGRVKGLSCKTIVERSKNHHKTRYSYGHGHDALSYFRAFFTIPIPDRGVNNAYDYPLGIFWYITFLALFFWGLQKKNKKLKQIAKYSLFSIFLIFSLWFVGSHQARWLYPVILILALFWGYFLANQEWKGSLKRIFELAVVITVIFSMANSARTLRSQRWTLGCFGENCLEGNQKHLRDHRTSCKRGESILDDDYAERSYLNCLLFPKS